jgi:predicted transcriptional regulator
MRRYIPLTINLPADVFEHIEEEARSQYSSRAAVARQILAEEIKRRLNSVQTIVREEVAL